MTTPRLSIGIPTCNRAHLWRRGLLWDSLRQQSLANDVELLICDDNSDDDTVEVLRELAVTRPMPFPCKVFRTRVKKSLPTQASALPDNVLFAEARGEWFVHLDDDGWVDRGMVRWLLENLPALEKVIWYGRIMFVDTETLQPLPGNEGKDPRMIRHDVAENSVTPMPQSWGGEWGAIWATRLETIRQIGGHEMENAAWRGCDSRFGSRIRQVAQPYFLASQNFTFFHLGVPWSQRQVQEGNVRALMEHQRLPELANFSQPLVANGGEAFWGSKRLRETYEEVCKNENRFEKRCREISGSVNTSGA